MGIVQESASPRHLLFFPTVCKGTTELCSPCERDCNLLSPSYIYSTIGALQFPCFPSHLHSEHKHLEADGRHDDEICENTSQVIVSLGLGIEDQDR